MRLFNRNMAVEDAFYASPRRQDEYNASLLYQKLKKVRLVINVGKLYIVVVHSLQ